MLLPEKLKIPLKKQCIPISYAEEPALQSTCTIDLLIVQTVIENV